MGQEAVEKRRKGRREGLLDEVGKKKTPRKEREEICKKISRAKTSA